jgi:hypothetical protein
MSFWTHEEDRSKQNNGPNVMNTLTISEEVGSEVQLRALHFCIVNAKCLHLIQKPWRLGEPRKES